MTTALRLHGSVLGTVLADLEAGTARIIHAASREEAKALRRRGFGAWNGDLLTAVYVDGDRLWLQVGTQRWNLLEPGLRLEWSRKGEKPVRSRFAIVREGQRDFAMEYTPEPALRPDEDPTADELDEELSDFLRWIARMDASAQWRDSVLHLWSRGV